MSEVMNKIGMAKKAAPHLSKQTTSKKNEALLLMAQALQDNQHAIMLVNDKDIQAGKEKELTQSLLDRLKLNEERITEMADGLREIAKLQDPIGEVLEDFYRPNGLHMKKIRVPLGVIGIIYEARPNVTVDAAGLCLKTGNAVVLRGGSSALQSNRKIIEILHQALQQSNLPPDALQIIENADRSSVDEMLKSNGLLDVIIPRGGRSLIQNVVQNATVPVIETGAGICHTYLDASAEKEMGFQIALNAKIQRPSVCNAMETLLIHHHYAEQYLSELAEQFLDKNVELRGCNKSLSYVPNMKKASVEDWDTEYNNYILNVKVVESIDEAMEHITRHGTKHSECIVTNDPSTAQRFLEEVDAAAVYHNASTRFTDGFEFGFGAEIGISTQKLHARGPMGLPALTSSKYVIYGNGQIRT